MSPFNARTTAEDVIAELKERLTGKNGAPLFSLRATVAHAHVVVVTGVSPGGLGTEVVRAIAPHANLIYVTGRNKDRYAVLTSKRVLTLRY